MKIDFNNYNVEFYFSFRNPYSYLAWTMLKKLMQDKKDALKPIEISAVNLDPKASYRPFWSDLRWKNRIAMHAKEAGIIINPVKELFGCSNAVGALKQENVDLLEKFITCVFKAEFEKQINVSDFDKMHSFLVSEGFTQEEASKLLSTPINNDEYVKEANDIWQKEHIRMLPTLKIKNDIFVGYCSLNNYLRLVSPLID